MNIKPVFNFLLNRIKNNNGFLLVAFIIIITGCDQTTTETVSLKDHEWTQHYDWIRNFKYERIPIKNIKNLSPPSELFVPAYTLEMIDNYVKSLQNLPWVMPTPSADENMIIGKTPGWPDGKELLWPDDNPLQKWEELDTYVPPQNIYGFMITDPDEDGEKIKVILTGGIHPVEYNGNWALHAMVEFLISDNPYAREIRSKAIFFVYPSANPDGRYLAQKRLGLDDLIRPHPEGRPDVVRGNPELYAAGEIDMNRVWQSEGQFVIIDKLKEAMIRDTGGWADYSWDFHGGFRVRHDYRALPWAMESLYSGALKKREPMVPRRISNSILDSHLWGWLALEDNGMYVKYPFLYEPHALMEKERIFEVGRSLALAFYDLVTGSAPHPDDVELSEPAPEPEYHIRTPERARRLTEKLNK
jgi:hypothetical protein